MGRFARGAAVAVIAMCVAGGTAAAQEIGPEDPGVSVEDDPQEGYLLLAPFEQQYTYLVDTDGRVAKQWRTSTRPGLSQLLTPAGEPGGAGSLEQRGAFATGQGGGGRIEALSWEGRPLWQKDFADDTQMQHHEIDVLPNGNVLAIVWERVTEADAIALGRDPKLLPGKELWADKIVEYDPKTDQVVWEWRVQDHLVQDHDPDKPNYVED